MSKRLDYDQIAAARFGRVHFYAMPSSQLPRVAQNPRRAIVVMGYPDA